jgi:hypothetical protein
VLSCVLVCAGFFMCFVGVGCLGVCGCLSFGFVVGGCLVGCWMGAKFWGVVFSCGDPFCVFFEAVCCELWVQVEVLVLLVFIRQLFK